MYEFGPFFVRFKVALTFAMKSFLEKTPSGHGVRELDSYSEDERTLPDLDWEGKR